MERSVRILLVLAVGLATAGCWRPPAPDKTTLAAVWLSSTCSGEEYETLVSQIRASAAEVAPLFLAAFQNGPPSELREALSSSVERSWARIQVQLADQEVYRLKQEAANMKTISLPDQKRRALEQQDINYRSAAIVGLGITGGAEADALLQKVATDPASRYRSIAAVALTAKASGTNRKR